jgi:hypothetical protein
MVLIGEPNQLIFSLSMDYNTSRPHLTIPEYGRCIQEMVEHTLTLVDRDERTKAAKTIVNAMAILNPQLKDMTDYRHKLWDHLYIISDYKLDCDSPYPMPERSLAEAKPKPLAYPQKEIKRRHYGSIVEKMIREAIALDEGEDKHRVVESIANFMKMSYLTWNRDTVSDELIREQLKELSGGRLELGEEVKLSTRFVDLQESGKKANPRMQQNNNRQGKKRNGFNRGK